MVGQERDEKAGNPNGQGTFGADSPPEAYAAWSPPADTADEKPNPAK